jgi:predicted glycogen debranching enzyme
MPVSPDLAAEWLEADGLGGYASGTVGLVRTRRYHGLLLAAAHPPADRFLLVGGLEVKLETPDAEFWLSAERYRPDVIAPDGQQWISAFEASPWPKWTFSLPNGLTLEQEVFSAHGESATVVAWRLLGPVAGAALSVRPLLAGRGYHDLHHENQGFNFSPGATASTLVWRPYDGVPAIAIASTGMYRHQPVWYRNFLYVAEAERGMNDTEDLAAPGIFRLPLNSAPAVMAFRACPPGELISNPRSAVEQYNELSEKERARRGEFASPLIRSADAYLVRRGSGQTIIAGYPWFGDWGRDTFIALRGLCLATGRLAEAEAILQAWAGTVSQGMLPNRFPDQGDTPEYNSVDASLWYVIAVQEYLDAAVQVGKPAAASVKAELEAACETILAGYAAGTRYGIRCDEDGLLAAGEPGWQLTWMDAKVNGQVITPRIGKPVEVQALWLNALAMSDPSDDRWRRLYERGRAAFAARFWNESTGGLYDVVDADHRPGVNDDACRPNQILAVGGLPLPLLEGDRARRVVDLVERELWTPLGLRTLSPRDPRYRGTYCGDQLERDSAYHQGTAWPWLLGPFVDAWLRVRGNTPAAKAEASNRFLQPLRAHLAAAGLGHVSEIVDGDAPHTPRGCPFQAWSLGELIRIERLVGR